MVIPDSDKIYGLFINTEIYNKSRLVFLSKKGFECGHIPHPEPHKIYQTVRDGIIKEVGEEEWLKRIKELHEFKTRTK